MPHAQGASFAGYCHGSWHTKIYVPPGDRFDVNISWAPSVAGSSDKLWIVSVESYMIETPTP